MSLLRDILQRRSEASGFEPPKALTSKRGMKNYASSVLSSGSTIRSVRSIAESVASFYSLVSGGSRVPKRRRAEVSRLGVPKFYKKNPKAAVDMPGVKYMDSDHLGPYTCAHAMSFGKQVDQTKAYWGSIVLYSHATPDDPRPKYHARARVMGEVRIVLEEPTAIHSIDVWLVGKQECILDLNQKPFLNAVAHVWDKSSGDPTKPQPEGVPRKVTIPFKGRFLPGTYVFPFEFPPLPRDAAEFQMDVKLTAPKHTRIHLPCSHSFSMTTGWIGWNGYSVGVNIKKDKLTDENAEWTYPFDYFPRGRPFVSPPSPFPFIATREDWPLAREDVGGWTLTPFGGRGRWRGETMVEIEGLLGVQAPPVLAPGQRLRFGLLLWCTNPEVLAALSLPGAFQVDFLRSDTFGLDVLDPHNSARKNRHLTRIGAPGRVWAADGPVPADDEPSVPPLVPRAGAIRKGMTAEEYAKRGKEMSVFTITQSGLGGTRAMEYAGEANVEESAVDLGELSRRRLQALGLSPVPPSNPSPSQAPQAGPSSLKLKPTPLTALTTVTMSSSASPATDIKREWLARSTIASSVNVSISSNAPLLPADKGKSAMPAQSIASESVSDLGSILDALESVPVLNADAPQSHLPRNEPLSPLDGEMREDLRVPSPTQSFEEEDEEEESKGKDGIKDVKSSASPAAEPAFDGVDEDDEAAHTTRLDGDLVIPDVTPPSYRWKYQGMEYVLHLLIQHPDYLHLSPSRQSGLVAETPLWIVTDSPKAGGGDAPLWSPPKNLATMPKAGQAIPVPVNAFRAPRTIGDGTDAARPTWRGVRTWAFL